MNSNTNPSDSNKKSRIGGQKAVVLQPKVQLEKFIIDDEAIDFRVLLFDSQELAEANVAIHAHQYLWLAFDHYSPHFFAKRRLIGLKDQQFFALVVIEFQDLIDLYLNQIVAFLQSHEVAYQFCVQPSLVGLYLAVELESSFILVQGKIEVINRSILLGGVMQRNGLLLDYFLLLFFDHGKPCGGVFIDDFLGVRCFLQRVIVIVGFFEVGVIPFQLRVEHAVVSPIDVQVVVLFTYLPPHLMKQTVFDELLADVAFAHWEDVVPADVASQDPLELALKSVRWGLFVAQELYFVKEAIGH